MNNTALSLQEARLDLPPRAMLDRMSCPACGARDGHPLLEVPYQHPDMQRFLTAYYHRPPDLRPLEGETYTLMRCASCGLAYQRSVPTPEFLQTIYDTWIFAKKERQEARALPYYTTLAEQVHFLIEHLGMPPREIRVLDFGMGWGDFLSMARAYGCRVYGVDLSVERQRHARGIGIEVLSWDDIPQQRFHFVNAEQVFEHLVEPGQTLRHLSSALAPNGLLRISVPNAGTTLKELSKGFGALSKAEVMPIHPLEHLNSFDPDSLSRFGQCAGLTLVRPSLRRLYNSSSGWLSGRAIKSLLRPLYRHVFPRDTIAYFSAGC
jgi:SAM-dependent methyltransferase